jgi:tetratricopeptide (TPR) repeat protein
MLGDYGKAINYQQQRLEIAQKRGNPQGQGQSLGNLGLAYLEIKDYARAIDYQQQSLAITQSIGDRPGEGNALNNLGAAFLKAGHLVKAENILHLGMQVRESLRVGLEDSHKISILIRSEYLPPPARSLDCTEQK